MLWETLGNGIIEEGEAGIISVFNKWAMKGFLN